MLAERREVHRVLIEALTIDGGHNKANLGGVSSAGKMSVYLLGLVLVQADEAVQDVVTSQRIIVTSFVVWEVVLHRADGELLLEPINLVQEQDNRSLDEPSRVADRVEECEGFLHTVDGLIFEEKLVVFGNSDKKEDGCDVLKAVDPLLSL